MAFDPSDMSRFRNFHERSSSDLQADIRFLKTELEERTEQLRRARTHVYGIWFLVAVLLVANTIQWISHHGMPV